MAYDATKPEAGTALVSADIRENFRALKEDRIVVANNRAQQLIDNLSIAATVGSKTLTVAVKGEDGNNCSASNVHTIGFRSATLTDGKPVPRTLQAASSIVLPSGATLGFAANEAGRIYVWEIDNAGTVEPALSRTADIFPESNLVSTTAIGADSDSASVMYSTTARTNVACRCIGYIEITTGATAGEWDNNPTKIQNMGPGVKRTGDIVQTVISLYTAAATGTTALPADSSIPQKTEGNEYMTRAITPTSAINRLWIEAKGYWYHTPDTNIGHALFQDDDAGALTSGWIPGAAIREAYLHWDMIAGQETETTFKVRAGGASGATTTFNSAAIFTGNKLSYLKVTEVFA